MERRLLSLERRVLKLEMGKGETMTFLEGPAEVEDDRLGRATFREGRPTRETGEIRWGGVPEGELWSHLDIMESDRLFLLSTLSMYDHKAKTLGISGDRRLMSNKDILILDLLDTIRAIAETDHET